MESGFAIDTLRTPNEVGRRLARQRHHDHCLHLLLLLLRSLSRVARIHQIALVLPASKLWQRKNRVIGHLYQMCVFLSFLTETLTHPNLYSYCDAYCSPAPPLRPKPREDSQARIETKIYSRAACVKDRDRSSRYTCCSS
jgi:hypothetical protein